jgi:DNA-binding transcriptional ArsR family regulator
MMDEVFQEIASLDRLIHEPARLAILTALMACQSADFLFLQRLTGLTGGNLSVHLSKLEEAGLIDINKRFIENRPNTFVELTDAGRETIADYWKKLEILHKSAEKFKKENP